MVSQFSLCIHAGHNQIHVFMGLSEFIGALGNHPHHSHHPHPADNSTESREVTRECIRSDPFSVPDWPIRQSWRTSKVATSPPEGSARGRRALRRRRCPHGLTVKQAVVQAWLKQVIKGSSSHLDQLRQCLEEEAGRKLDGDMQRAIFELIDNHRDDPPKPVTEDTGDQPGAAPGPAVDQKADVVKECEDGDEPGEG